MLLFYACYSCLAIFFGLFILMAQRLRVYLRERRLKHSRRSVPQLETTVTFTQNPGFQADELDFCRDSQTNSLRKGGTRDVRLDTVHTRPIVKQLDGFGPECGLESSDTSGFGWGAVESGESQEFSGSASASAPDMSLVTQSLESDE